MDEILHALYLRLDTTTNYLAKNAESQLLVKIIYQNPNATFKEILEGYKRIVKNANEQRLEELINDLLERKEIFQNKHRYNISRLSLIHI